MLNTPIVAQKKIPRELFAACSNGDIGKVEELLQQPEVMANVNTLGNRALCIALQKRQLDIVNRLLEIPAVTSTVPVYQLLEQMRYAATEGHFGLVNRLLDIPAVTQNLHYNRLSLIHLFYNMFEGITNSAGYQYEEKSQILEKLLNLSREAKMDLTKDFNDSQIRILESFARLKPQSCDTSSVISAPKTKGLFYSLADYFCRGIRYRLNSLDSSSGLAATVSQPSQRSRP